MTEPQGKPGSKSGIVVYHTEDGPSRIKEPSRASPTPRQDIIVFIARREALGDEAERGRRRLAQAERAAEADRAYIEDFARGISLLYPGCPEPRAVARHAGRKHSGRIGRTAAAKELDPAAITLAVRAFARHFRTRYDEPLAAGLDRMEARLEASGEVEETLVRWKAR